MYYSAQRVASRIPVLFCFFVVLLLSVSEHATAQRYRMMLPRGHNKPIRTIAFSHHSQWLASGSEDGTVKIWNIETGHLLTDMDIGGNVGQVSFSDDDSTLLVESDKSVSVWQVRGNRIATLSPDSNSYQLVSFVDHCQKILTVSRENIRLWSAATGKMIRQLSTENKKADHHDEPAITHLSPGGRWFTILNIDDVMQVWDLEKEKVQLEISADENVVSWTADDSLLMIRDVTGASIYNVFTGADVTDLQPDEHLGYGDRVQVSPLGKFAALTTEAEDSTQLIVWNTQDQSRVLDMKIAGDTKPELNFIARDSMILVETDSTLTAYELQEGKPLYVIDCGARQKRLSEKQINGAAARMVSINRERDSVYTWNLATGQMIYSEKMDAAAGIYFSDNDQFFAVPNNSTSGPAIGVLETATGQVYNFLWGKVTGIYDLAFSPDKLSAIAVTGTRDLSIRNLLTGRVQKTMFHPYEVESARYSKTGGLIFTQMRNMISLWDSAGNFKFAIMGKKGINSTDFSDDGKRILVAFKDEWWNIDVTNPTKMITGHVKPALFNKAFFSPNHSYVAVIQQNSNYAPYLRIQTSFQIFNAVTAKPVPIVLQPESKGAGKEIGVRWVKFSPNSKYVAICDYAKVDVFDLTSAQRVYRLKWPQYISDIRFSKDGKQLLASCVGEAAIMVVDAVTGKITGKLTAHNAPVTVIGFNPDETQVVAADQNNVIHFWDRKTGTLLRSIQADGQQVTGIDFIGSEYLLTRSEDFELSVRKLDNGVKLADIFSIDQDLTYVDTAGYFMTTSGAANKLYYVTDQLNTIEFDQLDIKYNRPDKVLTSLHTADDKMLESYRRAYAKRLKNLGVDSTFLQGEPRVPAMTIVNRKNITYQQESDQLMLHIQANDQYSTLQKFNIWVNDVPLFGAKGVLLNQRRQFDTSVQVQLAAGSNRIAASVTNALGYESFREPVTVGYYPKQPIVPKVHFIGIGIDHFAEAGHDLSWSVKDIRDLAAKLHSHYPDLLIDTLFNEQVTRDRILAMKEKIRQLGVNDKLVVSYSGHGLLSSDYNYYLSTFDVDFDHPETKGVSYESFENLFDSVNVRRKLVLIDACHSGELDKEEMAKMEMHKRALDSVHTKPVAVRANIEFKSKLGVNNTFELMQHLFGNLGKGTGAYVIAAAGGMQFAQENKEYKNGVFTYCVLNALDAHKELTVANLKDIVCSDVEMLTDGLQKPAARNQGLYYDWYIW